MLQSCVIPLYYTMGRTNNTSRPTFKIKMHPSTLISCSYYKHLHSQVDLFGPSKSYSIVNRRTTVNVWFVIFCCCTTGAISIKVMGNYSTDSFVLSFIRFTCCFGYPKMLLPDESSQLVKGCKEMDLSFHDIRHRLNVE